MRVMVVTMLTLAALATGFLFCPPLRHKMTAVLFGKQAQAQDTVHVDELAAQAAGMVKDGATSAIRSVRDEAADITHTVSTQILQSSPPVPSALTAKVPPAAKVAPAVQMQPVTDAAPPAATPPAPAEQPAASTPAATQPS